MGIMGKIDLVRNASDQLENHRMISQKNLMQVRQKISELKNKVLNREMTYSQYEWELAVKHGDKNLSEWHDFYSDYLGKVERIDDERRRNAKRRKVLGIILVLFFGALIIFAAYNFVPKLIGFAAFGENQQAFVDSLNLTFNNNGNYLWSPNGFSNDNQLTQTSFYGNYNGRSHFRIYLDNILIIDSKKLTSSTSSNTNSNSPITAFAIGIDNPTNENNIPSNEGINNNPTSGTESSATQNPEGQNDLPQQNSLPLGIPENSPGLTIGIPEEQKNTSNSNGGGSATQNPEGQNDLPPQSPSFEIKFTESCTDNCNLTEYLLKKGTYEIRVEFDNPNTENNLLLTEVFYTLITEVQTTTSTITPSKGRLIGIGASGANYTIESPLNQTYSGTNTTSFNISSDGSIQTCFLYLDAEIGNNQSDVYLGYTKNLQLLYHFNNKTGENESYFKDFSINSNNATTATSENLTYNEAGKIMGGLNSYGTSGIAKAYTNTTNALNISNTSGFTIAFWINARNSVNGGPQQGIMTTDNFGPGNGAEGFYIKEQGAPPFGTNYDLKYTIGGSNPEETYTGNLNINQWYHVVLKYSDSVTDGNTSLYIDGLNVYNGTFLVPNVSINSNLLLGLGNPTGTTFNGTIDEVAIWNQSLSDSEIFHIYDSQRGTNLNLVNTSLMSITNTTMTQRAHYAWFFCQDNSGGPPIPDYGIQPVYFSIVSKNMNVKIKFPVEGGAYNKTLDINVTTTENGTVQFSLDGGVTNITMQANASNTEFNYTNQSIADGQYTLRIYANDTSNVMDSTPRNVTFLIDNIQPLINFTEPTPINNNLTTQTSFSINITTNDTNNHSAILDFNNDLYLWLRFDNNTDILDKSVYTRTVVKNGTSSSNQRIRGGARDFKSNNDFIRVTNPPILSESRTIAFWIKGTTPTNNVTIIENYDETAPPFIPHAYPFSFKAYPGLNYTNFSISAYGNPATGNFSIISGNIFDNNWHFVVGRIDATGIAKMELFVDGNLVSNSSNFPLGNTDNSDSIFIGDDARFNQSFNGTLDEIMIFGRALSSEEINTSYNGKTGKIFRTFNGLSEGTYLYKGYTQDSAGNINSTETRQITIDTTAPTIQINLPLNQTYSTSTIPFNVTTDENATCLFSIDDWTTNYTMQKNGLTDFNYTKTSVADGIYNTKFYCNDTLGNWRTNTSVTFYVGFTPITSCQDLNQENITYRLQNDVQASNTCFNISANNVTLNCQGYSISHDLGSGGYGLISNYNLTKVFNCIFPGNLTNSTQNYEYNIYLNQSFNSNIYNNNFTSLSGIIYLFNSSFINISNNILSHPPVASNGNPLLNLNYSSNLVLYNNNFTSKSQSNMLSLYGIFNNISIFNSHFLGSSDILVPYPSAFSINNATASNLSIYNNSFYRSSIGFGNIQFDSSQIINLYLSNSTFFNTTISYSGNNVFINNFILTNNIFSNATSYNSAPFYLYNLFNFTIENNIFECRDQSGRPAEPYDPNDTYYYLLDSPYCVLFGNVTYLNGFNNTIFGTLQTFNINSGSNINITSDGPYTLLLGTNSTSLKNLKIAEIYLLNNSNVTIYDSNASISADHNVSSKTYLKSFNTTVPSSVFDNVKYGKGANAISEIYWYLNLNVTDQNGNLVSGAEVDVYDYLGNLVLNTSTNSTGRINKTDILEKIQYNQSNVSLRTPHTINISYGTSQNNSIVNFTNVKSYSNQIRLSSSPAPQVIINNPQNLSYNQANITFNVTTDISTYCNYTLDGGINNYSMQSNGGRDFNYTNSSMPDGNYLVNFTCGTNTTMNRRFNLDATAPSITINLPLNQTYSTSSISFNFTTNENSTCIYSLDGGLNNVSMQKNGITDFNQTNSSIADGAYQVFAYCNDTNGNLRINNTRWFSIDSTLNETVNTCGIINSPNKIYTLYNNISSERTCISITASNITLDCGGYSITYADNGTSNVVYGINISNNLNNTKIINCIILGNSTWIGGDAIRALNGTNYSIINNTFKILSSNSYAIDLEQNHFEGKSIIANNTFVNLSTYYSTVPGAISASTGSNSNGQIIISGNNINLPSTDSIIAGYYSNTTFNIYNNFINATGRSIVLTNNYSVILNNTLSGLISLHQSSYTNISGNIITVYNNSYDSSGIQINDGYSQNNLIQNNLINSYSINLSGIPTGIYFGFGRNDNLTNNTLNVYSKNSAGIYINNLQNVTINNLYVHVNDTQALSAFYINGEIYSSNLTVFNSIFNASASNIPDILFSKSKGIINFTNVTYNDYLYNETSNITFNVKWWFLINVTNSSGSLLPNANVTLYDSTGLLVLNTTTNSTGTINKTEVLEFLKNNTNLYLKTPHNLTVVYGDQTNTTFINFTNSKNYINQINMGNVFTGLNETVTACGVISTPNKVYTLYNNISSEGTCISVTASNITLDGSGYILNYSTKYNGAGINLTGNLNNITIKNLLIHNGNASVGTSIAIASDFPTMDNSLYNSIIENNTLRLWGVRPANESGSISLSAITIGNISNTNITGNTILINISNYGGTNAISVPTLYLKGNGAIYSNDIKVLGGPTDVGYGMRLQTNHYSDWWNITSNNITFRDGVAKSGAGNGNRENILGIETGELNNSKIINNNISFYNITGDSYSNPKLIYIGSGSMNNLFLNNFLYYLDGNFTNTLAYAIDLQSNWDFGSFTYSLNNTFSNNTFILNSSVYSLFLEYQNDSAPPNIFIDNNGIENYTTQNPGSGTGITLTFEKVQYGKIELLRGINGTGANLSKEIQIGNNSALINSTINPGLNRSANITLYHMSGWNLQNSAILRDGIPCSAGYCYNYTPLTADTVKFNVSGAGRYTLNSPPRVSEVYSILTPTPNEAGIRNVQFYFLVNDTNGYGDVLGANATFTNGTANRTNSSCIKLNNVGIDTQNFSCTIGMWYFDNPGQWNITIWANDTSNTQGINSTTSFTYGTLTAFVIQPNSTAGGTAFNFATINPGETNKTPTNNPMTLNNTGNVQINSGEIRVNATNLEGETNAAYKLYANNFTIGINTGGSPPVECGGTGSTRLTDSTYTAITGAILPTGNLSVGGGIGQEQLYICLNRAGNEITQQAYSTAQRGAWTIVIAALVLTIARRRKLEENKVIQALKLLYEELGERYDEETARLAEMMIKQITTRTQLNKTQIYELVNPRKEIRVPLGIFQEELGGLEAIVKYLKENMGMSYAEIGKTIKRDERTIWNSYNKACEKNKESYTIKESEMMIPLETFNNEKLTILETLITTLRKQGMSYAEIGRKIGRDQRNVRTIAKDAEKKEKELIITITATTITVAREKNKEEDRVIKALRLLCKELGEEYNEETAKLAEIMIKQAKERNDLNKVQIYELVNPRENIQVPTNIFTEELGGLEAIVKYLRENIGMSYAEIGKTIKRDERTIWNSYAKANEKKPEPLRITSEVKTRIPIEVFSNEKLTILEALIIYLRKQGMSYAEIGRMIGRDQRNIRTIGKEGEKKI